MCRVTAPLAARSTREATSRPPLPHAEDRSPSFRLGLHRRLRILRHRALRWFDEPIAVVERERRDHDLDPSVWRYGFPPRPLAQNGNSLTR
jgi:hypothetical protein